MGTLMGTVCKCGMTYLPPRDRCVKCSALTKPAKINDEGNLLTYTVLQVVPEGFEAPLVLGLVQLDIVVEERGGKIERNDEDQLSFPKVVGVGKISEDELEMDRKVRVEKMGEIYYFRILGK